MRMLVLLSIALLAAMPLSAQAPKQSVATPPPDVAAPPADAAENTDRTRVESHHAGHGQNTSRQERHRHGSLHRLEDGRIDVRQFGAARQAVELPARPRHRRLDRRRAADGRRRETALLDSRSARLQGTARAERHARVRRRAALDPRHAGRRQSAAGRREADGEWNLRTRC